MPIRPRVCASRTCAIKGIDPSTARRQFQKAFGMTFHAYQRARRMGAALTTVRERFAPVIDAQVAHGFESASGFREAFAKVFGAPPSRAVHVRQLLARWIDTPLGAMLAVADNDGLHLIDWVDRRGLERAIARLKSRLKAAIVAGAARGARSSRTRNRRILCGAAPSI